MKPFDLSPSRLSSRSLFEVFSKIGAQKMMLCARGTFLHSRAILRIIHCAAVAVQRILGS
jgi:hypothetical protein